ncbi:PREDICTED: synaptonemal complex protein 2-like [Chlamydotis macqueenii]|uniref:synaptonemal complex protein 2-like n=1 Tax=Chlamydotis macqueenii TaxID=187382 RepID=UPI00052988F5|nr:PREDICTED: synaptonemal complex protein 2-like [Chlamydotis macqueenii]
MAQEEKSEEWNKEMNGNMAARAEDYLESLLTDAFKGKGFQKISELLQEREIEPPQKYSESLFNQIDKALRKELDKNEFQNVSLLLKCIQLYFKSDLQEGTSLFIEQGLVLTDSFNFYLVPWFERARAFVNLVDPNENNLLMLLLEDFFDSALVKPKLADEYNCIVALSEALCRLMTKKWRDDLVHHWFEDNYLAEAFKEIKDREFETKTENEAVVRFFFSGNGSTAVMLPQVKKPSDEKLEEFWIDFNVGSQSVTFYVDSNEINVAEEESAHAGKQARQNEAVNHIKKKCNPQAQSPNPQAQSPNPQAQSPNPQAQSPTVCTCELVIPESANPQGRKDSSNSKNMDSLPDNLASQHSQQLTSTVPETVDSGVTMITVSQQTDVEDANQGSANKSKTPSPRMKAKPSEMPLEEEPMEESAPKKDVTWEKRNRKTSSTKQKTEGRKEIYDFENSDSASHEKVAEAKGKILGQKISSQNQRNYETANKSEESNKLERRQKQSLPKSLDYTRKRPRVRSKLKVLPMSSASSGSDYRTKKKFLEASGKSPREEGSFKRKDSDILNGTDVKKPKLSSRETSHLSSDALYKPRKLFDSVQKEEEIQTGQEMDESVGDAFALEMLREDFGDSGLITAFESFNSRLHKLFWSRSKRMEMSAQNALRTSEKNVSALLNQIHERRLNKLDTFRKIVIEELSSLEKETQMLSNMEKDIVVCMTTCVPAHGRIPSQYERPMNSTEENSVFIVPSD